MRTVGFIGLGNIGCEMSLNLLNAGFDVVGFDVSEKPRFREAGGQFASSSTEVAANSDIILQSLPSSEALIATVDQILPIARDGQIVIELSTYPVQTKRDQAARLAAKGVRMLDCEVSGLPEMVRNRTAVIFQAGDKGTIEEADDVFEAIAERRFYIGEFGAASKMKLLANLMVCVHNMAAAEVLNLGARTGLDPKMICEVLGPSAAGSATFKNKAPLMVAREFEAGSGPFQTIFKYLDLVGEMATEAGVNTPLMDAARGYYEAARKQIERGERNGEQDIAAILEIIEAENG